MKKLIKEEILEQSRILFNERGYHQVSMRMISSACKISVGNLTYHYPRKLDIAKALLEQGGPNETIQIDSLLDLYHFLCELIDGIRKNHFFFSSSEMQELESSFFQSNKENVHKLHSAYLNGLVCLQNNLIFNSSFSKEEMESIVSLTMLSHLSWANEERKDSTYTDLNFEEFIYQHFLLLKPYFTDKGVKQFNDLKKIISL